MSGDRGVSANLPEDTPNITTSGGDPIEPLQALADRVVDLVVAHPSGDDHTVEANARVTRTRHGLTRFANSFIHQHVGEDTVTVAVTVAVDGRSAGASTTAVDDGSLTALVDRTLTSAARQPVDPFWPGATPVEAATFAGNADPATADADPSTRAAGVKAFVDAGSDLRAAGFLDSEVAWSAFASTAGQRIAGATTRATIDGIHQTATSAGTAHQTSVRIGELDAGAVGERAADLGRRSAEFVDVEPGSFEVVLGPEAVATIVTFLSAYGFNAKAHLEGASFAHLGEAQFDPGITLIEDPTDPRAIALPFDAEGSPRQRYDLVRDGVTTSLAHDRRTSLRAETSTTGNAVPGGEGFGAIPMNPMLVPGTTSPVEMIRSVERGLLVTQFHYCRILDPKTQAVTGLTRNGTFLIEKGKVVGAVGNLRFTQSFLTALEPGNVLAIGNDDRHASGEFGPGMIICPSLHLNAWNFTGGAKG